MLVINYSHSALTAALAIADCAYEYRRVLFSPELDADANPDAFDRPPTKDVKQRYSRSCPVAETEKAMYLWTHCAG